MANNDEYRDYSDAYSARSENTNTSVKNAKRNRFLLDNNMNWYVFENTLLMGLDYLDRYKNTIFQLITKIKISKEYYMRPEYVSYKLYGTTDLWYILLWLNNMKNPNEFIKSEIFVIATERLGDFQDILDRARVYTHNEYNPTYIHKHYLKHPKLPSTKLLPDSYNEKIYDCGFVTYGHTDFLKNLSYIHNHNDYYHGKSKMTETKENIFTNSYKELSVKYMDGIQISNNTCDPIFDNSGEIKEYKFTGYMYFPHSGIYDFQLNGINGTSYLIIGNDYCVNDKNEKIINLPEVNKKFDFFELKTKNSDFKKRSWQGWTYHNDNLRLLTDVIKRKPVAKTVITNDFFDDDTKIITKPNSYNIIERINNNGETNFITYKTESHSVLFYNKMSAEDLNIDLEPYNNGNDGKIIFTCELLASNVINLGIQPYIKINYTDSSSDKSILSHYNIGTLWNTNEYETLIVSLNKDKTKKLSTIEFGIICEKNNIYEDCNAEISINQVSINLTEFDIVSCKINDDNKSKWLPFVCSYKYNGNIMKMFHVKRRSKIIIDSNNYLIDKGKNILNTKDSEKLMYKTNDKNSVTSEEKIDYLISPYDFINRDQLAIVPMAGESSFSESVLVTVSNNYDREACFLQHNVNKEVEIYSENNSTISFKTCLLIEDNKSKYKLQLNTVEDVEIYLDNMYLPVARGKGNIFYFSPTSNNLNNYEISTKGYRFANFEIYIKNTRNKKIKLSLSVNRKNIFEELSDDFFVVRPYQIFDYSNINLINKDIEKKDVILLENSDNKHCLNVFKPGIITIEEKIQNRECTNYVLDFDIRINSDQNGQFIINMDKQTDGKKYGLIFNYCTTYSDNPEFVLKNGLYANIATFASELSNIDKGIDFYKHKYKEIPPYKNMLDVSDNNSLKKFEFNKDEEYHIKIKKKKNYISLQINNKYIAIWHDYDNVFINGLCGFTFINLNNVYITNLNMYC